MNDDLERADGTHLDRRSLLKKAGAAGALSLAAPIAFDSFFSPAAAASCAAFTSASVSSLTRGASTDNLASYSTAGVVAPAGQVVLIAFAFSTLTTPAAITTATVSGTSIAGATQLAFIRYAGSQTLSLLDFYVAVYRATSTGTAGAITISLGTTTALSLNHSVLVASPEVLTAVLADSDIGTGAIASASFAPVDPNNLSVMVVSGQNGQGNNDPHTWNFNNGLSELDDVFADNGQGLDARPNLSLATAWKDSVTTPLTATASQILNGWGSITVELSC